MFKNSTARSRTALNRALTMDQRMDARATPAWKTVSARQRAVRWVLAEAEHVRTLALLGISHSTPRQTCAMALHAPLTRIATAVAPAQMTPWYAPVGHPPPNRAMMTARQVSSGSGSFLE